MKRLVFDIDGTLTMQDGAPYPEATPRADVIERLRRYHADGFEIILFTSRNMRTHQCSVGRITAKTLPIILDWLERHDIPYDEIHVGKPWCGTEGFYIDDRAIRPSEFLTKSRAELDALLDAEKTAQEGS
ncbi:capsular biosynthesis protein [Pseudodesulfovibrio cashew]|uniref:Capsular biosynthesis protein n=1 Tax=Pseudodesulfovibrio cashew TaxID=2678688 RepID=A0A6I6JGE4_9BACT|nr:capsular biosynthesis protein [Pseudodesulfovibrio cashew]QGY39573.1 capsular biosynthesis protein [Pseudodesulfovibrio cashew]